MTAGAFAVLAAVLSSALTGYVAENGIQEQMQASAHQSVSGFLLAQKHSTYMKLVQDALTTENQLADYFSHLALDGSDSLTPDIIAQRNKELSASLASMDTDCTAIQMLGTSAAIVVAASTVDNAYTGIYNYGIALSNQWLDDQLDDETRAYYNTTMTLDRAR